MLGGGVEGVSGEERAIFSILNLEKKTETLKKKVGVQKTDSWFSFQPNIQKVDIIIILSRYDN